MEYNTLEKTNERQDNVVNITDVRLKKIEGQEKMKAVVSVTFDDDFVVHDIKIIDSPNGFFIAMPSRRNTDGTYKDVAHPINSEAREKLQKIILDKYNELP